MQSFTACGDQRVRIRECVSQCKRGKTGLDLNEARDDGGSGTAVASAGPYANNLHLGPYR